MCGGGSWWCLAALGAHGPASGWSPTTATRGSRIPEITRLSLAPMRTMARGRVGLANVFRSRADGEGVRLHVVFGWPEGSLYWRQHYRLRTSGRLCALRERIHEPGACHGAG